MTQANPNFGKIIPEDEDVRRDAVHVAVVPCIADETLMPGDHVAAFPGSYKHSLYLASKRRAGEGHGIVDPFLDVMVEKGERFYLFLYPNTVQGMRHHWSHPAFHDEGT